MDILIGLLIIAVGALCQSSCYVPINKIKGWSWESYWLVQGVFAWILFPLLGALLAVPEGHSLLELLETGVISVLHSVRALLSEHVQQEVLSWDLYCSTPSSLRWVRWSHLLFQLFREWL